MHTVLGALVGFLIGSVLRLAIPVILIFVAITGAVICNA